MSFQFYFGYSMEHPALLDAIDFAKSIGSAGGEFLQFDGMKFRDESEIRTLLKNIMDHGIQVINLTFYGTQEYHDRFAGRKGDFAYMLNILQAANHLGLKVTVGIAITAENAGQMEALIALLGMYQVHNQYLFVPHSEGRGACLESIRLTADIYNGMSKSVKRYFNSERFKSEKQWLTEGIFSQKQKRILGISLTSENIGLLEQEDFAQTITRLEDMDTQFYERIPSLEELARKYGNIHGGKFYSERDLYLHYQACYMKENAIDVCDMNDERFYFSRRF